MLVIRPPMRWLGAILGAFAFFLLALLASVADTPIFLKVPLSLGLFALSLWILIRFPRVAVHEEAGGLRVVGSFRTYRVRWEEIEKFELSYGSTLLLKDGTRRLVTAVSFGSPAAAGLFGAAVRRKGAELEALIERHR